MKDETIIDVLTLRTIYELSTTAYHRLNSLIQDYAHQTIDFSETDYAALLDSAACSLAIKIKFEDYFNIAEANNVESIKIPTIEFTSVLGMAKTVEFSMRTLFGSTGIWDQ